MTMQLFGSSFTVPVTGVILGIFLLLILVNLKVKTRRILLWCIIAVSCIRKLGIGNAVIITITDVLQRIIG